MILNICIYFFYDIYCNIYDSDILHMTIVEYIVWFQINPAVVSTSISADEEISKLSLSFDHGSCSSSKCC